MIAELKSMGIELMVSIWPTVEKSSEKGRGYATHYDATNPEARKFVWETAKRNYHDKGIKIFWLDEAEPEYTIYDFDIYRYWAGPNLSVGNIYPSEYAKGFYEGMLQAGQKDIVNLVRCA
jgi:alpha-D-xyloside xylohydrolase